MNRNRLFFYLAFVVYQAAAFIFTIMVDGHLDLLGLLKFIPWFKYISFLGMAFILVDLGWYWMEQRATVKKQKEQDHENNVLKAKIYDYQEAAKNTDPTRKA